MLLFAFIDLGPQHSCPLNKCNTCSKPQTWNCNLLTVQLNELECQYTFVVRYRERVKQITAHHNTPSHLFPAVSVAFNVFMNTLSHFICILQITGNLATNQLYRITVRHRTAVIHELCNLIFNYIEAITLSFRRYATDIKFHFTFRRSKQIRGFLVYYMHRLERCTAALLCWEMGTRVRECHDLPASPSPEICSCIIFHLY